MQPQSLSRKGKGNHPLQSSHFCGASYLSCICLIGLVATIMATKIKGIYKGFKYISQIFVVKEREMEIGYPTDVKHVAHIGWDGPSGSAPTWMNEFKTASDFAATSIGNITDTRGPGSAAFTCSSQDFESVDRQPQPEAFKDGLLPTDLPKVPKKPRRKKVKSTTSSPKSSSSRSSRAAKAKAKLVEENARGSTNLEVM